MPHRVIVVDQLNKAPLTGHFTGETLKGDGLNALFDRMPEDTLLCITMVVTPQDMLEGHLQQLSKRPLVTPRPRSTPARTWPPFAA